jgi:MoaA/NifB/PqqE/SkfB family radical SAM enzyme
VSLAASDPSHRRRQDGLPPPQFLFVHVNKRCNLRCRHCDYWQLDDGDRENYLRGERMVALLTEFAELSPGGKVVICGGEKLLDPDDFFPITTTCRRLGLRALGVTNGTLIREARFAERLIREGSHEVSVSLNSHRRELHDETRGVPGAFDRSVRALRLLIEARERLGAHDTRIHVMGLVFGRNYEELEAFYDFVLNEVGADKLKLNFLQPTFGNAGRVDDFFAAHRTADPERLMAVIDRCDARFGLGLNPAWKRDVEIYFRSLRECVDPERGWRTRCGTREPICNAYERNIVVDHYGKARLCFSTRYPGLRLRERGDLRRFWEGAGPIRWRMRGCRYFCGISHSVRRETSTLASRRPEIALHIPETDSVSPGDAGRPARGRKIMTAVSRCFRVFRRGRRN